MGKISDILRRSTSSRIDSSDIQDKIANVRRAIFECGMPMRCAFVDNIIGPTSLTAVRVSAMLLNGDTAESDHQSIK